MRSDAKLQLLADALKDGLLQHEVLHADDTPVVILSVDVEKSDIPTQLAS